jgi:ABC-type lipoprotein export system ATPase subunit
MKKERLTYSEMRHIVAVCEDYLYLLAQGDSHLSKCMMAILAELMTRIEKRTVGFVFQKGYLFKLKTHEKECLLYLRNERAARLKNAEEENAVTRLLVQNN